MKAWKSTIHEQAAAAVEAWHAVASDGGKVGKMDCLQFKKRKPAVWKLTLESGSVRAVVAKQASLKEAHLEDCIYRDILPGTRLPAPGYFGLLPAGDRATAWIFVEYVEGDDYSADDVMHRALATEWLASFHSILRGIDPVAPLVDMGPGRYRRMLDGVSCSLAGISANPAIGRAGRLEMDRIQHLVVAFAEEWDRIDRMAGAFARTLLHGSFGPRNMRVTQGSAGPMLRIFDWGAAGWGIPARDVAKLASSNVKGDLSTYCARCGLGEEAGRQLVALGTLFRSIEHLDWTMSVLAHDCSDGSIANAGKHAGVLQELADSGALGL